MLIDTNIALYLLTGDTTLRDLLHERSVSVSFITEMELLSYPSLSDEEHTSVRNFLADCVILDLNTPTKRQAIRFRRQHGLTLPDALIGATASVSGQPFLTADQDFRALEASLSLLIYEP